MLYVDRPLPPGSILATAMSACPSAGVSSLGLPNRPGDGSDAIKELDETLNASTTI